ncbi:MAG: cell division protein FtsZ [Methanomassiliicoccales archaeon]|nr:MAG: cell division protein FtsZ [Methanomassiliicoccales archaeon]
MLSEDDEELLKLVQSLRIRISIIGCGGGGSNTIRRITQAGVTGATIVACNSDARHLLSIQAPNKILLGKGTTKGLGAGAIPEVGQRAAEESEPELRRFIEGANIVFVTAGMGGGTGTGSAPVVAEMARRYGALVIGVVTLPFKAEGKLRMENAMKGLSRLQEHCDTVIVIQNERLLEIVPKLPIEAAFKVADEVLMQSIKGITEVLTKPGLVNVDFNDIMTITKNAGLAMIGLGESDSDDERIDKAVGEAMSSPLLGEVDLHEAKGALVRVVGGPDMTVAEAERAAELVSEKVNPRARIIWGCSVEPEATGRVRVLVVITGVRSGALAPKTEPSRQQPRTR